uniref:3'-5' exonuclease domain-containing protein n=1 Tax=Globisporangium ultimum (strain ATCC 200006 / CBS 805.95 / DAOM BR144) TaxID=431595 RepID=K3X4Q2_GLOUD
MLYLNALVQTVYGASTGGSLSSATTQILAKPLDKRMQVSNWEDRPLSMEQVQYAALDAHCLVQISY